MLNENYLPPSEYMAIKKNIEDIKTGAMRQVKKLFL